MEETKKRVTSLAVALIMAASGVSLLPSEKVYAKDSKNTIIITVEELTEELKNFFESGVYVERKTMAASYGVGNNAGIEAYLAGEEDEVIYNSIYKKYEPYVNKEQYDTGFHDGYKSKDKEYTNSLKSKEELQTLQENDRELITKSNEELVEVFESSRNFTTVMNKNR